MRIAVAAVLVAFGVGVGWGIFGHGSPLRSAFDPGRRPDGIAANTQAPPTQLQSAYGLAACWTRHARSSATRWDTDS
jgi:hypothetical protein